MRSVIIRVINKIEQPTKRESDLLIMSMITEWILRQDVLLPINQNYKKNSRNEQPSIERWTIIKRRFECWKPSNPLKTVHRNSAHKMTRIVQLQAWRVHCPINAQIGMLIANHFRRFCYSFE